MQCQICNEVVTNPVCVECLYKEMEQWLLETKPTLIKDVKEVVSIYSVMPSISRCVLCNHDMTVCRHCFTKEIFTIIQDYPELEEDFLRQFDYGLIGY